jgi:hypothetical protein
MDANIKQLVIESVNELKKESVETFRNLLQYPYHQDTKFVILEIRGDGGYFGINVSAMASWEKQLLENAYGEPSLLLDGFLFQADSKLDCSVFEDDDMIDEIDNFVKDYLVTFLQECFNDAGGKLSKIPYYLYYPNTGAAYDLLSEKWLE